MPERRTARVAVAWTLAATLVLGYTLMGGRDEEAAVHVSAPSSLTCAEDQDLDIVEVVPGEPVPGGAIQIRHVCETARHPAPMRVFLSVPVADRTLQTELEILHRGKGEIVARVPKSAPEARHKLRIQQGDERERRSKPYDLRVVASDRQRRFANAAGGLALLLFGLQTMASGGRAYAGHRGQGLLARLGRRTPAAIGLGALVGGITQFTTTAAGLVVGLIEAHVLSTGAAAAILLGAQLGSAATASLLGLTFAGREGLLVIAVGVVWLSLAPNRRATAIARIILGCGLLFYGLHLLRLGFDPLVTDPALLPYMERFRADGLPGLFACVAAGAALSAILQGPGPVLVLVLGLAQASGHLDLQSALAILAGTSLGASVGTAVVAWPFGREAQRLAGVHFFLACLGSLLLAASVGLWAFVAEKLVPGAGKDIGGRIAAGFVISQAAVTLVLATALPFALALAERLAPAAAVKTAPPVEGEVGLRALREGLGRALDLHWRALLAIIDLGLLGDRGRGTAAEDALADARAELEGSFAGAVRSRSDDPELERLRQAALAALQMQRAIEDLLRQAERGTERAMALSPEGEAPALAAGDAATLKALNQLLLDGIAAIVRQLKTGAATDLDSARSREIRLNALEVQTRHALLADRADKSRAFALRLNSTSLVSAYENVGNHLYRLYEALASEVEQDQA